MGIFSRNRPEWTIIDMASILYGYVTIPLYDTLGDENISYVFNHTKLTTVFVNDISVRALIKTHDMGNVKTIVSFDPFSPEEIEHFAKLGISLKSYQELLKIGKENRANYDS